MAAPRLWVVLARCHRAMGLVVEQDIAETGLSVSDFQLIETLLHKGPLTISEIQGSILLATGSMTAAVDRVEKKGLIVRKSTPKDRRARVLELTENGRKLAHSLYEKHVKKLDAVMSVLGDKEIDELYSGLKKLGLFAAVTLRNGPERG